MPTKLSHMPYVSLPPVLQYHATNPTDPRYGFTGIPPYYSRKSFHITNEIDQ